MAYKRLSSLQDNMTSQLMRLTSLLVARPPADTDLPVLGGGGVSCLLRRLTCLLVRLTCLLRWLSGLLQKLTCQMVRKTFLGPTCPQGG